MKKQILFILILVVAVMLFNSCEKESTTNDIVAIDSDAPKASYENPELDGPVKELEIPISKESIKQTLENYPIIPAEGNTEAVQARDYAINLGSYTGINVACGNYFAGSLYNRTNKINNTNYSALGYSSDLNGGDEIYVLNVSQRSNVTFNLTNATQNLAMSLFEGQRRCISNTGTGIRCELLLMNAIASAFSASVYGKAIGPIQLEPGTYILVVDSRPGYASNFNLQITCNPVYPSCVTGTTTLLHDDFDTYRLGLLDPQSYNWAKYNPWASYDAEVGQNGGSKYATIQYQSNTSAANQPSPVLLVGSRTSGNYVLSTKMWIFPNQSAYFDVQTRLTPNNTHNEVGARIYFYADGTGRVYQGNSTSYQTFTYPQNQWMTINLRLGLDNSYFTLGINGLHKVEWRSSGYTVGTGARRIEAIRFYPFATNSQFFLDEVCFAKYN